MPNLKIDDIVNVVVYTTAKATARDSFNTGLIVGKSSHITKEDRCKIYGSVESMQDDGFLVTDPEYKAASLYFSQSMKPGKVIVGVCDGEESWLDAVTACRAANRDWYAVMLASEEPIGISDHQAVAAYVETLTATYFYSSNAEDDVNPAKDTDVFSALKKLSYKRSFGLYSAAQFAAAAAMGYAMGANNGTADSAFTMAYKQLVGIAPDDLTETQVSALQGKNANYYIERGGKYQLLETGVTADGTWYDEVIGIDQLANDIQIGCMDVLANTLTKVPYTDAGALQFVIACNEACAAAQRRGFLAPGIWHGSSILELATGDALDNGYLCQAEPVADQSTANRSLRVCPPIYVCVILAGAIHSVTIQVNVE